MDIIKLSKNDMQKMIGPTFNSILKKVEGEMIKQAKEMSSKKLSSITVTESGISLDDKIAFLHIQGRWAGSGALNYTIRWKLNLSTPKIEFLEDVGKIPD